MLGWNTIEFPHVAFGLVLKILNSIDVIVTICKQLRVVNSEVFEL